MKVFKVDLYEYFGLERGNAKGGILTCFVHENSPEICLNRLYPAMVVFPGGGYAFCSDREAEPIAVSYYANGFNSYLLHYSLAPDVSYPVQLCEAAMAIAYVRRNSKEQFTNIEKIATIGFSAGGHLCGNIATGFATPVIEERTGIKPSEARPNAAVLSYAVISSASGVSGMTFNNLCGMDPKILPFVEIDQCVTKDTPPLFIWHTTNDGCVIIENALKVAVAANKNGVPFEMHVFQNGPHGISLCDESVYNSSAVPEQSASTIEWFKLSVSWLKDNGFFYKD